MDTPMNVSSPFGLLLNPEAIFIAIAQSERLNRLKSRVCRPLDRVAPAEDGASEHDRDDDMPLRGEG